MDAERKVINGLFPVTTTKAVYMDGTNKTLQQAIENGELGGNVDLSSVVSAEKKAYIFPKDEKIVIDNVNCTITIPRGTRIQLASTNNIITDYTETVVLDYSTQTNDVMCCLYWDNTNSCFIVTGNYHTKPDSTHDNYLVTSFLKANPINFSLNRDAFILKNNSYNEIIELTVFGDSLTAYGVWPEVAMKRLNQNFIINNLGIGGSTMSSVDNSAHNPMCERVNTIPTTTNVLTILAGTNDLLRNGSNIGELGSADTNTFLGAYESTIEQIYALIPNVKIIIMTLPPRFNSSTGDEIDSSGFRDATIKLAKKYHLPCINLNDELGINIFNRTTTLSDGHTHFSDITKKRVGAMLANVLKSIL